MRWLSLLSVYVPEFAKCGSWVLWDRRQTWRCCRAVYVDFNVAYRVLKIHESTLSLLKRVKDSRNERRIS